VPEIPEPIVTAVTYRVSCLPIDHPAHRHYSLTVAYRIRGTESGYSVSDGADYYYDADGAVGSDPVLMPAAAALALAQRIAPTMTGINGQTVADILTRA